jgi:hypothetical protein
MDLVAFELLADSVGPSEQVVNIALVLETPEPEGLVTRNLATVQDPAAKLRDTSRIGVVKHIRQHG